MGDPLLDAVLNSLRINVLCRIFGFELHSSFAWPVMRLDRHPAQGLNKVTDQMAGGVHARVELATLFVDPNLGHAEFYRAIDKMDDSVRVLNHAQHLAFTDPAGVEGLSAPLWMKQRGAQHHREFILAGRAVQHFNVGLEIITMEKQAKRHSP
ncbi:hypothetical protein D3C84_907550 [compost metagenome]